VPTPINWNDLISWIDELEEPYRSQLPFTESSPVYSSVPDDIIISSNAEHHSYTDSGTHILCPGSAFCSGNFDVHDHFQLQQHGYPKGFDGPWQKAFAGMIRAMDYPDAGGIIIAHPTWFSKLSDSHVCEMLDFDERVLGIEIYNDLSANGAKAGRHASDGQETEPGLSLCMWDRILSSGRRCWGFCVPDHSVRKRADWLGRSVLLVNEFTEHNCLKAYRDGQFYGCLKDNGLTITDFAATDVLISVSTNATATIKFISEAGTMSTIRGDSAAFEIPRRNGSADLTYVRIEVEDGSGERLFLQPVMYHCQCQKVHERYENAVR